MKRTLALLLASFLLASVAPAATILFDLQGQAGFGLLPGNETTAVSGTPGTGGEIGAGISFDNFTNVLTINVGWGTGNGFTNLTGAATASHIHGPTPSSGTAAFTQAVGVLFNLTRNDSTANAGFISTTVNLTGAQATELLAGRYYINIHTSTNSGGEIRGNLVAVPEPGRAMLSALALLALITRRRR
jgi:hypothetical protein